MPHPAPGTLCSIPVDVPHQAGFLCSQSGGTQCSSGSWHGTGFGTLMPWSSPQPHSACVPLLLLAPHIASPRMWESLSHCALGRTELGKLEFFTLAQSSAYSSTHKQDSASNPPGKGRAEVSQSDPGRCSFMGQMPPATHLAEPCPASCFQFGYFWLFLHVRRR